MFSYKCFEIFKNIFFHRTPPVSVSDINKLSIVFRRQFAILKLIIKIEYIIITCNTFPLVCKAGM